MTGTSPPLVGNNKLFLEAFDKMLKEHNGKILKRLEEIMRRKGYDDDAREERIKKENLSIQPFKGRNDPEAYIQWEMKIEQLFSCHKYTEEEKVNMAAMKLSHYALLWWDKEQKERKWYREPLVNTWEEMRKMMRKRYAHSYYLRELHNKKKEFLREKESEKKEELREKEKRKSEKREELRVKEKESEKKEELREKENESKKNEDLRKEENEGENNSDGQLYSCKEVDLNSNDLSLSRGAEIILQGQESCDLTSTLRIEHRVGLIPSAPLATKPAFMTNPQEGEQEVVYVNLTHMDDCFSIGDKTCMLSASSHVFQYVTSLRGYAYTLGGELETTGSNYAFRRKYFFKYLDEYGYLQSVWHADWDSFLAFEFIEHECFISWFAFMILVFDPGGNQELNSRANFLEE